MLGERLAEARRRAGMTQTELAVALGKRYNAPMISMVERGRRGLLLNGAVAAARELKVSLDYLAGLTSDPTPAAELAAGRAGLRVAVTATGSPPADHVLIPFAENVRLSAGPGEPVLEESQEMAVLVALAALENWARPERLHCARAAGDSMVPTVRDGDLVAIDCGRTDPVGGRLFALRTGEGLVVKRLRQIGGRWHMVSDNKAYGPRPVGEDDRILGQVAWTGPPER